MARSWQSWLLIGALFAGGLLVACGGEEKEPAAVPTAQEEAATPEEEAAPEEEEAAPDEDSGAVEAGEDEAFADVPLPEGADETSKVTMSIDEFGGAPPGTDIAGRPGEVTMKSYDVEGSPGEVIEFYQDRGGDWEETFSTTSDEGGVLVWTGDGGERIIMITTGPGADEGTAELFIQEWRVEE